MAGSKDCLLDDLNKLCDTSQSLMFIVIEMHSSGVVSTQPSWTTKMAPSTSHQLCVPLARW
jgi:hypothetical protein